MASSKSRNKSESESDSAKSIKQVESNVVSSKNKNKSEVEVDSVNNKNETIIELSFEWDPEYELSPDKKGVNSTKTIHEGVVVVEHHKNKDKLTPEYKNEIDIIYQMEDDRANYLKNMTDYEDYYSKSEKVEIKQKMSFNKLNKIIKNSKKLKAQQIKEKLNEFENEIIENPEKIHILGIGYKKNED